MGHLRNAGIFCLEIVLEDGNIYKVHRTVLSYQKGVVRTNCIDCLDRTNVAKQITCARVIDEFVIKKNPALLLH